MDRTLDKTMEDLKLYERSLKRRPKDSNTLSLKANALIELFDATHEKNVLTDALNCCDKCIEYEPNNAMYFADRAKLYLLLDNVEFAIRDIKVAVDMKSGVMESFYIKGINEEIRTQIDRMNTM